MKIHVKRGTGDIFGATIVASNAGDLISEIGAAMASGMGLGGLAGVIHPYPTQADAIRRVGIQYRKARFSPNAQKWVKRMMAWRRR